MTECIFCKIVAGKIPSRKVYEDDEMLAFHDIILRPLHFMIIPGHIESLAVVEERHAAAFRAHARQDAARTRAGQPGGLPTINTAIGGDVYHLVHTRPRWPSRAA
jgi:histidine triad (HIT) family protein